MVDFRMKLDAVKVTLEILDSADRRIVCRGDFFKALRNHLDMIAVTHPHRAVPIDKETVEEGSGLALGKEVGVTVLTLTGWNNLPAKVMTHQLHAITDSQHGDAEFEQFFLNGRSACIVN